MNKYLFKFPITLNKNKAEAILRRLFDKFNSGKTASEGELLSRIGTSIREYFSRIRRSRISEYTKVSVDEGPSSTKINQLFDQMTGDMQDSYDQQNAIDQSVVEVHNYLDIRKEAIKNDLKRASQALKDLITLTKETDTSVIIFEDTFDTQDKTDTEFTTALDRAMVDTAAGVVTLNGDRTSIPLSKIISKNIQVTFDGEVIDMVVDTDDNTFSDGKLYGDPRDLGENGIRIGRDAIATVIKLKDLKISEEGRSSNVKVGANESSEDKDTQQDGETQDGGRIKSDGRKSDRRGSLNPDGTVGTTLNGRRKDQVSIIHSTFPNPFN